MGEQYGSSYHGRGVDAEAATFLKLVNAEMSQQASIRYLEIHKSLHGDMEVLKDAVDRGVPADRFVAKVIEDFGLMRTSGDVRPEIVHGFNKTQAAICEYAMQSPEWRLGTDGVVYREEADGLGSLRPLKQKDTDHYGFGTFFHEGASLGEDGRPMDICGRNEPISGNSDIAEAVQIYESRRGNTMSMSV